MYFIVNPASGRGRGRKVLEWLRERLEPDDELAASEGPGDCERLAAEAAAGRPAVTVAGGDGTVAEVLNGIAASGFRAAMGILPVGTANDLAIYVDIPTDWERALQIVRAGHVRQVDVGLAIRGDERRYFVTTTGAGVNAVIASREQAETDKAAGSPITYVGGVVRELLRYRPIEVEVSTGGDLLYRGRILMTSVSNGEQEGGIFKLAPGARADDGFLHLLILGDVPTWQRPWYALQSMRGRSGKLAKAQRHRIKAVTLRTIEETPFYLDGEYEPLPAGEVVEIRVEEGKLGVIAPE